MEEQPSFQPDPSGVSASHQKSTADVIRRLGRVLLISIVASLLYALVVGPRSFTGFSDGLFIVGALLLIVGLLPLVADIFNRNTVAFRSQDTSLEDILEEERGRSQRLDTTTVLFGLSGVITMVLSFIVSFVIK